MSDVIHRTTLRFLRSVNTPDYPEPEWKHNPDMSAVTGVDFRYWKWDAPTERPVEMTAGEKQAVDDAETTQRRDQTAAEIEAAQTVLRALAEILVDEINILRQQFNATTRETVAVSNTNFTDRTLAQFRAAMRAKLDG